MLDVDATQDVTIAGRVFRVSQIPAGVAHALEFRQTRALAPIRHLLSADGAPLPGAEATVAAAQLDVDSAWLETCGEWIRWGLRSYADAAGGVEVKACGRTWRVLAPDAVERILRAEGGYLALAIAREVSARQRVSVDEALGFLLPPGSA